MKDEKFWYHGTTIEKAKKIIKEGLKVGKPVSYVTQTQGFASPLTSLPVSLAKREKDAVFFASGSEHFIKEKIPTQAILKIDISRLKKDLMEYSEMFERKNAELRYFDDIPPEAIKEVLLRKFTLVNNKLKVDEERIKGKNLKKLEKIV